jgi:hypothetical protein
MEQLTIAPDEINPPSSRQDCLAPPSKVRSFRKTSDLVEIEPVDRPPGTSKSMAQAMGCPDFFVRVYLHRSSVANRNQWLKETGVQFHEYFRRYNEHLRDQQLPEDPAWREHYLARPDLSQDGRSQIANHEWRVEPRTIVAIEEMFSIDRDMNALPPEFGKRPGEWSSHDNVLAWGTPDLVLLEERPDGSRKATVIDPKSGFSTVNIGNYEPQFYAGLVMKHFERVEEVEFIWKFTRFKQQKSATYTRAFLPEIEQMWRFLDSRKDEYIDAHNRGERLPVDPSAGMCPYCPLACEMRQRATSGELIAGPVQSNEDAVLAVKALQALEGATEQIRAFLKPWITANGMVNVGNGFVADFRAFATHEYPLEAVLTFLGLVAPDTLPAVTPVGRIPLSGLTVGGLSGYLKRKKRADVNEAIKQIANLSASSRLAIYRRDEPEEPELEEQLARSIEAVEQKRRT